MSDAAWNGSTDGDYNDSSNWNPATVPGSGETAMFDDTASVFSIGVTSDAAIGAWIFNSGHYDFSTDSPFFHSLIFDGEGIETNGGSTSILNLGQIAFQGSSSAGSAKITTQFGFVGFSDSSTASNSTLLSFTSTIQFDGSSTAESATIVTHDSAGALFIGNSTAASATIENYGSVFFGDDSTAGTVIIHNFSLGRGSDTLGFGNTDGGGNATIDNYGVCQFLTTGGAAQITNEVGGKTDFLLAATAGDAIIITKSGGLTRFVDNANGGDARFITDAGGFVNFATTAGVLDGFVDTHRVTAGSIEGAGAYDLGFNELTVGSNDFSTTVSGAISGSGGSIVKTGAGSLKLSGANTFDAGITLNEGTLDFASLSAAGTGHVNFDSGTQTLIIENSALSARAFANEIDNFDIGDAIELSGLRFVTGHTRVTYNDTTDLLKITNGKVSDKLTLADPETNFFKVQNHGGHVKVIITAARPHHDHLAKVADHHDSGDDFGRDFQLDSHHAFSTGADSMF